MSALYLLHADPLASFPAQWEPALDRATTVIAHAMFLTPGIAEHANVVFPAESWAEREGTLTHPDGRLQRLRAGIGRPGDVRAGWQVLSDLCKRLGADTGILTGAMATARMAEARPLLRRHHPRRDRRPRRALAGARGRLGYTGEPTPGRSAWRRRRAARGRRPELALGTFRSIWAGPRSRTRPRCTSCARARACCCRPPTPSAWSCSRA